LRPHPFNSRYPDGARIPAVELASYIESNPLDTTYNGHQVMTHLELMLKKRVTTSTMLTAALFADYAVIPAGRTFRFVKFDQSAAAA